MNNLDASVLTNCRSISQLSIISKILEIIVSKQRVIITHKYFAS